MRYCPQQSHLLAEMLVSDTVPCGFSIWQCNITMDPRELKYICMIILSHRGLWLTPEEKNTTLAFARSFSIGYGTETDLRDHNGELVIAHDPAGPASLPADVFFELVAGVDEALPLALNIKADGLQPLVLKLLARYGISNAFVFDMSVPDTLGWIRSGLKTFSRQSEYEREPPLLSQVAGVWLDSFESDWWTPEIVQAHLDAGKEVAIVSPELHGRTPEPLWRRLAQTSFKNDDRVLLCTDRPSEADEVIHA